jgi:hypothetical protein
MPEAASLHSRRILNVLMFYGDVGYAKQTATSSFQQAQTVL